jgi:hypothetical protein
MGSRPSISVTFNPADVWHRFFVTLAASIDTDKLIFLSRVADSRVNALMTRRVTLA